LLQEAVEGPSEGGSWFTDNAPDAGFLGSIRGIDAPTASRILGQSSIAAHVYHSVFGMDAMAAWIRGDRSRRDWKDSWRVSSVTDAEWKALQESARRAYDDLVSSIRAHALDDDLSIGAAMGSVAHLACHLGAIRQKLVLARPQ
jgi:hypothetical protein